EARGWFEQIIEREMPEEHRQWLLWALCQVVRVQGDGARLCSAAEEYLALSRRLEPDGLMVLEALRDLGLGYGQLREFERMSALHEEALAEARARSYADRTVTILVHNLGYSELLLRHSLRGREFAEEAFELAQSLGDLYDCSAAAALIALSFLLESRH